MRNLNQPLTNFERSRIVDRQIRQQATAWLQDVASEGTRPVVPNYVPSPHPHGLPGLWAKITGIGKNDGATGSPVLPDNRDQYEWCAVVRYGKKDENDNDVVVWQSLDGTTNLPDKSTPHPLVAGSTTASDGVITNSAIHANGDKTIPVDTVVWLTKTLGDEFIISSFVPSANAKSSAYYLLLSDLDEATVMGFANLTEWNTSTYCWENKHSDESGVPIIDPAWTVVVVDSTRSVGAWTHDFISCQPLTETIEHAYYNSEGTLVNGTFAMVEVVNRLSNQTKYVAYLPPLTGIGQGGSLTVDGGAFILINGLQKSRTLYDMGLIPANSAIVSPTPDGMYVEVSYLADVRKWCVTGAPCDKTEYL